MRLSLKKDLTEMEEVYRDMIIEFEIENAKFRFTTDCSKCDCGKWN